MDWAIQPFRLNPAEIVFAQQKYNELVDLQARFICSMREFNNGLRTNEKGDPILPLNGEPGYQWREEYRAVLDTIDGALERAALAMVRYKSCVPWWWLLESRMKQPAASCKVHPWRTKFSGQ